MEKSKVYYTDFRTTAFGNGLPAKLKELIKAAGIEHKMQCSVNIKLYCQEWQKQHLGASYAIFP